MATTPSTGATFEQADTGRLARLPYGVIVGGPGGAISKRLPNFV
jgi:hypothetical protein